MNPVEAWYLQIPICTRIYLTSAILLTLAAQLGFVTQFQLFYTYEYAIQRAQYWRLLTTFLYLGKFSMEWCFNMYFIVQCCRDLEEGTYLNRPADFAWTTIIICGMLLVVGSWLQYVYLGQLLVSALTYMWSRHYSYMLINFMGLFTTSAAYLPWVMMAVGLVVDGRWPTSEVVAVAVGHVCWFLDVEWPRRRESGGKRWLSAPRWMKRLLSQDLNEEEHEE